MTAGSDDLMSAALAHWNLRDLKSELVAGVAFIPLTNPSAQVEPMVERRNNIP
ncbi:hypothetical protein [Nocardia sp. NPDC005366]|uniref:hypothetical protein n=1 Tax=Nocardia sp. NPDC005366 TaxID=3156878 RepID=UPI0033B2BABF